MYNFFDSFNFLDIYLRSRRETTRNIHEDMLLVQSIKITDKFGFEKQEGDLEVMKPSGTVFLAPDTQNFCVNGLGKLRDQKLLLKKDLKGPNYLSLL